MAFHSDKAFILRDHDYDQDTDKAIIKANKNIRTFFFSGKIKQPLFVSLMIFFQLDALSQSGGSFSRRS